jgi:lysophospholipase L1-like esterase
VQAANGTPILVTSLTRRSFAGTPPRVVENLANERDATITVAESLGVRWIDLNRASTDYVNAIGPNASWAYNYLPDDRTHLNEWGSVVFGRLVSDLLVEKYEDVAVWTRPNVTLSAKLREGVPA